MQGLDPQHHKQVNGSQLLLSKVAPIYNLKHSTKHDPCAALLRLSLSTEYRATIKSSCENLCGTPFSFSTSLPTFLFIQFLDGGSSDEVGWSINVISVYISLLVQDIDQISNVYWPFVFLLLRMVSLICPFIDWMICLLIFVVMVFNSEESP